MSVIDLWAERHIQDALNKGELSNLNGEGKPLQLDDDSLVPEELRAGYRILKNSGYLPAELQQKKKRSIYAICYSNSLPMTLIMWLSTNSWHYLS